MLKIDDIVETYVDFQIEIICLHIEYPNFIENHFIEKQLVKQWNMFAYMVWGKILNLIDFTRSQYVVPES